MIPGRKTDPNAKPPKGAQPKNMLEFLNECRAHLFMRDLLSERENENCKSRFRKWVQRAAKEKR